MKKIFLLLFVVFSCLIFYQIILGKNGIIEAYRIKKEKEKVIKIKLLLQKRIKENSKYIDYLKNDPDALKSFAEELGFFENEGRLIKIIDETKKDEQVGLKDKSEEELQIDKILEEIKKDNSKDSKINKTKTVIEIFFYIIFGFFIILTIFGVQKKNV